MPKLPMLVVGMLVVGGLWTILGAYASWVAMLWFRGFRPSEKSRRKILRDVYAAPGWCHLYGLTVAQAEAIIDAIPKDILWDTSRGCHYIAQESKRLGTRYREWAELQERIDALLRADRAIGKPAKEERLH